MPNNNPNPPVEDLLDQPTPPPQATPQTTTESNAVGETGLLLDASYQELDQITTYLTQTRADFTEPDVQSQIDAMLEQVGACRGQLEDFEAGHTDVIITLTNDADTPVERAINASADQTAFADLRSAFMQLEKQFRDYVTLHVERVLERGVDGLQ